MARSYIRTAASNDTTALLLKKVDQILTSLGGGDIVSKFNTLQSSYAALLAKYNTLEASYAAVIAQLNLEVALTQGPYVDGTAAATDGTTAATGAIGTLPVTAASELM
jgi:hypothetical protein